LRDALRHHSHDERKQIMITVIVAAALASGALSAAVIGSYRALTRDQKGAGK
jgi:hypothetical protein